MAKNYRDGYRPRKDTDRARMVAANVLQQVEEDGAFANLVLPGALRAEQQSNPSFSFRDAAFTAELVYGTLRQQGYLDTVLAAFCSRPLEELESAVLRVLRQGAYQLLFMRVPDHAAVAETVDIAREFTTDGPVRLVNAVLRSITRAKAHEIDDIFDRIPAGAPRLAARYSHPEWIVRSLEASLAERGMQGELIQALEADNEAPKVSLVARPGLISATELAIEAEEILGRQTMQGQVSEYAVILEGGDPAALPSVRDGRSAVQDEGSQLAAVLLAETPLEGSDVRWLDLCAGPGGKTALLAALASDRQGKITANEVNPRRAKLVERSVRALDNVEIVCGDGRTLPAPKEGLFDRVLVDAPCSGLGSLRRRPESRWRHTEADLDELVPLQNALLERGLQLTRPGGVLAWVTCTPQVEETLDQVRAALLRGGVTLLDAAGLAQQHLTVDLVSAGTPSDPVVARTVQLWPHLHGTDAMFIALLRKESKA